MISIFDILLIGLIVFAVGRWLARKRNERVDDTRNLTDTQRNWRKYRLEETAKLPVEDQTPHLRGGLTRDQEKNLEVARYIQENVRPFNLLEWMLTSVDLRLAKTYILNIVFIIAIITGVPFFVGLPFSGLGLMIAVVVYDILNYRNQRIFEVTLWNPEFKKKFGLD